MRTVADLRPGERGTVTGFSDQELSIKLLEMGVLPGTEVIMRLVAPFGDPVCIEVSGYNLSMRMNEASTISLH